MVLPPRTLALMNGWMVFLNSGLVTILFRFSLPSSEIRFLAAMISDFKYASSAGVSDATPV